MKGCARASVLKLQEVIPVVLLPLVQIGLNMVAILGGGIGESALSPYIAEI